MLEEIKTSTSITLDTRPRPFRIYFGQHMVNEVPGDVENEGTLKMTENSIIPEILIPELIKKLESCPNPRLEYSSDVYPEETKFWPLKYILFYRIDETRFTIRTRYYNEVWWRKIWSAN